MDQKNDTNPTGFGDDDFSEIFSNLFGTSPSEGNENYHRLMAAGSEYVERGEWERAIQHFSQAISTAPENASGHSHRARCYWAAGNLESARDDLQTAIRLDPENIELHVSLGEVYCQLDNHTEAVRLLERVRSIIKSQIPETDTLLKERLYRYLLCMGYITDCN